MIRLILFGDSAQEGPYFYIVIRLDAMWNALVKNTAGNLFLDFRLISAIYILYMRNLPEFFLRLPSCKRWGCKCGFSPESRSPVIEMPGNPPWHSPCFHYSLLNKNHLLPNQYNLRSFLMGSDRFPWHLMKHWSAG